MPQSYRDLPEWQEAQRAFIAEGSDDKDADVVHAQRVRAAFDMWQIEKSFDQEA